jgi:RecA/RadA recombinase
MECGQIMNSSDKLISSLDCCVFKGLISRPRSLAIQINQNPDDNDNAEELRQQILTKLKNNAGQCITTIGDVLNLSPTALLHILDPCLTYVECNRFITRIHEECAVRPVTALDVMRRSNPVTNVPLFEGKLSTGLPSLDAQLRGGFPVCSITEIVGRAGAGKTHLSQQLCVLAATSGGGGAIYVDTENKMSVVRLKEIALERGNKRRRVGMEMAINPSNPAEQVLENVTVHSSLTTRELSDTLDRLDKEINQRNTEASEYKDTVNSSGTQSSKRAQRLPVRLLVIDSIAAPLRRDYSSSNSTIQRSMAILEIAQKLKRLADEFQLAVVVVNQVGSGNSSGAGDVQRNDTLDINEGDYTGSLGTVWQHCVSTRIALEHDVDPHRLDQEHNQIRKVLITKSLLCKNAQFNFELTHQGVHEVAS